MCIYVKKIFNKHLILAHIRLRISNESQKSSHILTHSNVPMVQIQYTPTDNIVLLTTKKKKNNNYIFIRLPNFGVFEDIQTYFCITAKLIHMYLETCVTLNSVV